MGLWPLCHLSVQLCLKGDAPNCNTMCRCGMIGECVRTHDTKKHVCSFRRAHGRATPYSGFGLESDAPAL